MERSGDKYYLTGGEVSSRLRRSAPYILGITLGFSGYETLTQIFLPGLTMWQSHFISIAVVAVLTTIFSVWFQRLLAVRATQGAQLAEQLRQEERFRALIQHAADVISVIDPDGTIRYQSPTVERLLGYDETALVGTDIFALVHPDDHARAGGLRHVTGWTGRRCRASGAASRRLVAPCRGHRQQSAG